MDKKHVKLINDNLDKLVSCTHYLEHILDRLKERQVLNTYMIKYITKFNDEKSQLMEFYKLIQGRGPNAFNQLQIALRHSDNFQAEEILSAFRVSFVTSTNAVESKLVQLNLNTPDEIDEEDTGVENDAVDDIIVKVHPQKKFMDNDKDNLPSGTYRMRSNPRGFALIINIHKGERFSSTRSGSEKDVQRLEKLFIGLGYSVTTATDLSKKEFEKKIQIFSTNKELSKVDSCVVFIMTHGTQHAQTNLVDLETADGLHVNSNWITQQFAKNICPLVTKDSERKPKMFFFQACRVLSAKVRWSSGDTDGGLCCSSTKQCTNRGLEDCFIVYPTITGSPSMRDPKNGAWFVEVFCRIVAENAWRYDLYNMLLMVHEEIRERKSETCGTQTLDLNIQGVSKTLYLNPGLFEEDS